MSQEEKKFQNCISHMGPIDVSLFLIHIMHTYFTGLLFALFITPLLLQVQFYDAKQSNPICSDFPQIEGDFILN